MTARTKERSLQELTPEALDVALAAALRRNDDAAVDAIEAEQKRRERAEARQAVLDDDDARREEESRLAGAKRTRTRNLLKLEGLVPDMAKALKELDDGIDAVLRARANVLEVAREADSALAVFNILAEAENLRHVIDIVIVDRLATKGAPQNFHPRAGTIYPAPPSAAESQRQWGASQVHKAKRAAAAADEAADDDEAEAEE